MNLRRLDLNLLVIFDALMAERNVTRAANRIGLSQPAVSNALSRLRHYLKDELFIRSPDGMRPTPRALELASEVHNALATLESALDPASFDPATAARSFTIDTTDYMASTVITPLMCRLAEEAPGIDVRLVPPSGRALERLEAGETDFAIGAYGEVPERYGRVQLDDNVFVVVMRAGNALASGRFSLQRYAAAKHLLVTPRGDAVGFVDEELARAGLERRIALTVNQFSVAPAIIAKSDLIATLPKRVADFYTPLFNLAMRASPFGTPAQFRSIDLVWHKRLGKHAAYAWFRDLLRTVIVANTARPLPRTRAAVN
jgi:DNA-binding transcriptional LysR family regulator